MTAYPEFRTGGQNSPAAPSLNSGQSFPPGRPNPVAASLETRVNNYADDNYLATFQAFIQRNNWFIPSKVELKALAAADQLCAEGGELKAVLSRIVHGLKAWQQINEHIIKYPAESRIFSGGLSMNHYKPLLVAIVFFVLGCLSMLFATHDLPESPSYLADTEGVPAVVIYVSIMMGGGLVAVLMTSAGILISIQLTASSFIFKMSVFVLSNILLVLASLLGISIIAGYVLDTLFSIMGVVLYVLVIALVVTSVPRQA